MKTIMSTFLNHLFWLIFLHTKTNLSQWCSSTVQTHLLHSYCDLRFFFLIFYFNFFLLDYKFFLFLRSHKLKQVCWLMRILLSMANSFFAGKGGERLVCPFLEKNRSERNHPKSQPKIKCRYTLAEIYRVWMSVRGASLHSSSWVSFTFSLLSTAWTTSAHGLAVEDWWNPQLLVGQ